MSDPKSVSNVAFNVLFRRLQLGWSQRKLAQRANVSNSTVGNLESGAVREANSRTLSALANALGCTADDLLRDPVLDQRHPEFNEAVFIAQLAAAMGDEPPDSAVRMANALRELFRLSSPADMIRFLELWAMTEQSKRRVADDNEEPDEGERGYESTRNGTQSGV